MSRLWSEMPAEDEVPHVVRVPIAAMTLKWFGKSILPKRDCSASYKNVSVDIPLIKLITSPEGLFLSVLFTDHALSVRCGNRSCQVRKNQLFNSSLMTQNSSKNGSDARQCRIQIFFIAAPPTLPLTNTITPNPHPPHHVGVLTLLLANAITTSIGSSLSQQ